MFVFKKKYVFKIFAINSKVFISISSFLKNELAT